MEVETKTLKRLSEKISIIMKDKMYAKPNLADDN